ncbi:MAG: YebC/PmpR family DNA-binding transcriptional regulator [Planctomycetes bacterium]|nr:YebC/PmpR family DNA-binding transcriptional regulator [Planctomycetota bacterium]MCB9935711.1 YebC/PmpR family DNA-binding transcriptional regulator [Planctomycetota bacterium]
MAGHSKWANIKHRKAAVDKKRGKIWSKLAHGIIVAARLGGGDPETNNRLADAIVEARKENMPAANIDRAIKRGTGELAGADPEELVYEGYAPGGVAIIVEALTDNRKRTAPDIKHAFEKNGGNLGQSGSVMHSFDRKGIVVIEKEGAPPEDQLLEIVAEAGAEDLEADDDGFTVTTPATALEPVKKALQAKQIGWISAQLEYLPHLRNEVDEETARKVQRLVDALEDNNDVQNVYTNHEPPESMLAELR